MTILVVAEHDHGTLKKATLNAIAAAQKIGGDIHGGGPLRRGFRLLLRAPGYRAFEVSLSGLCVEDQ